MKLHLTLYASLTLLCTLTAQNYQRCVLTGGPGTGKSTVTKLLEQYGFQTIPEVYNLLKQEAKDHNTFSTFFDDHVALRKKLITKQIELEAALNPCEPAFLDRSTYDTLFFGEKFGIEMSQELVETARKPHYTLIFFLDPLPQEFYKKNDLREETYEQSVEIHQFLKNRYTDAAKNKGFIIINVPFDTPENRAAFIVHSIS